MSLIPGLGIAKGMALTLRRFFEPKVTIMYPEVRADVAPKFRGRLQLLYDEWGTLKCETCFQCAQACPIECIDMGGVDSRGRYHVHWGPPETYGERREESASQPELAQGCASVRMDDIAELTKDRLAQHQQGQAQRHRRGETVE